MNSLRIIVVEDDYLQAHHLSLALSDNFPGSLVEVIRTESAFNERFEEIAANPPSIFIIDMILPWASPSPETPRRPAEIAEDGFYRAGLRCEERIAHDSRTANVPVILYSLFERDDVIGSLTLRPHVAYVSKQLTDAAKLCALIRSLLLTADQRSRYGIFLVHGHDDGAKETVARFIERLGLKAVILHEQVGGGKTVIEKIEAYSDVSFAVVLLTPDDVGGVNGHPVALRPRARQNVIFELGFFLAKLGRHRICALQKGETEIPSDYDGVVYIPMDLSGAWRAKLEQEIRAAGLPIGSSSD